jgi:hypothetical protein
MTHLLVCALCAGAVGPASSDGAMVAPSLALDVEHGVPSLVLDRGVLPLRAGVLALADASAGDGHSGHDDGAHMGPMWIMMGVMMVGMMVVTGAHMMRGHWATPLHAGFASAPHLAAIPPAATFRPGG